jgi:NAD(P)-dependent dehydrogenase (short-subunit alcohol dehydrogenase family)
MADLHGKVAVVTGGNGGIGLGMAEGLVAAGADVAIWGRDEGKNADAEEHLRELAPDRRVVALRCDVADEQQVIDATAQTVDALGRIDACIANAGVGHAAPITEMSLADWRRVMAVNLDGAFLTMREAAKRMIAQGDGGAMVAVSSTSAIHGAPMTSGYAASKAGLLAFVRSCAVAWARHGIRVNAVLPGWTRTDMTEGGYQDERFREATTRRTPVRRWGEPADFREVAAFLCDPSQTFHTGDTIVVDGGYTVF